MKTTTYAQAQRAWDSMEHPDYWDDREEKYEREAEEKAARAEYDAAHDPDYSEEDEYRMEWDELSNDGQQRRMERNYEEADRRRKEIGEDELIRGAK